MRGCRPRSGRPRSWNRRGYHQWPHPAATDRQEVDTSISASTDRLGGTAKASRLLLNESAEFRGTYICIASTRWIERALSQKSKPLNAAREIFTSHVAQIAHRIVSCTN